MHRRGPFQPGEPCLLLDAKGRRYLLELRPGREFHYHRGVLAHDEIIGAEDGSRLRSSMGSVLIALRPRLADYTLKMGRGATVVYPKDAAEILAWADIGPGDVVVEAGTGSGALTMWLARAVVPDGRVVSIERREDHHRKARELIAGYFGEIPAHVELRIGSVEEVLADVDGPVDRVVLDLPEPWTVVTSTVEHLRRGGIFACYLPTVPQVQEVRRALNATRQFVDINTFEVLLRDWSVEGRSVRPSHRMIGHTGFITVARKIEPLPASDEEE